MAFSESWRKRNACERCRRHKVRCEYEDPSSQRCIRCAKSNSECVVKDRGSKKGGENTSPGAVPEQVSRSEEPQNGVTKAQAGSSPLLKAAHDGIYEFEELGVFYDLFVKNGNFIPACEPPKTLCELDKLYPLTSLMLVTCVALSMSCKNATQRLKLIEGILSTGMGDDHLISYDSHSALILACQFLLPFGGKGLMRLNLLHGSMLALQQHNGYESPIAEKLCRFAHASDPNGGVMLRLYEFTAIILMASSLDQRFERITPIAALYNPLEAMAIAYNRPPVLIYQIFTDYRTTTAMMEQTSTLSDLMNMCAMGYEKLSTTVSSCPKAHIFIVIAQLKLAAAALSWAIRALGASNLDPYQKFFETVITRSVQVLTEELLVNYQYSPTPMQICYMASSALNLLWLLRIYCFAANLDIDVPVAEFCDLISNRWQAMAAGTYTGRSSFVALIRSSDLVRFELGYYNESSGKVEGSGKMDTFFVYLMSNKASPPLYEAAINSADLREIMRFDNMRDRKPIGCVAMIPNSYPEFEEMFTWVVQGGVSGLL